MNPSGSTDVTIEEPPLANPSEFTFKAYWYGKAEGGDGIAVASEGKAQLGRNEVGDVGGGDVVAGAVGEDGGIGRSEGSDHIDHHRIRGHARSFRNGPDQGIATDREV